MVQILRPSQIAGDEFLNRFLIQHTVPQLDDITLWISHQILRTLDDIKPFPRWQGLRHINVQIYEIQPVTKLFFKPIHDGMIDLAGRSPIGIGMNELRASGAGDQSQILWGI